MGIRKWKSFADQGVDGKEDVLSGMSNGFIVQNYCLAVTQQPTFDFGNYPHIKQYQSDLNGALNSASNHANDYLDNIQPQCLNALTRFSAFLRHQDTRIKAWQNGEKDLNTLIDDLTKINDDLSRYKQSSIDFAKAIDTFRTNVSTDCGQYKKYASTVTAAVTGDNGIISQLESSVSSIDDKIKAATAGSILSAFSILGGGLLAVVGAAGEVFTGGASTAAVVAGVAIAGAGVAGEVTSGIMLSKLADEKAQILSQIKIDQLEIKAAAAASNLLVKLLDQASDATTAAQKMASAWNLLSNHLSTILSDLKEDLTDKQVQDYLDDYQADIVDVKKAFDNVESQFTNVQPPKTDTTRTVSALLKDYKLAA